MSASSQSYPMRGGDDQHSYIHNSSYQKAAIDGTEEKTRQYILEKLDLLNLNPDLSTFTIADFGCSIGPNTFHAVQNIIDAVKLKHLKEIQENSLEPLEFQVYFNDQPNNDFNTLFRTQHSSSHQEYFSVGVQALSMAECYQETASTLDTLPIRLTGFRKFPITYVTKKSPAWNKSYIQCNNLIEEVTKAYKVQFTKDMNVFLKARAEELVPGGLMIALGQCLPDGVPMYKTWQGIMLEIISECLLDMATLGLPTMEKIKFFNLPVYFPKFSELKGVIEQNGSFTIEMMEIEDHPLDAMQLTNDFVTSMFRAILSTIIEEHFGDGVVDELFNQLAKKLSKQPIDFELWIKT